MKIKKPKFWDNNKNNLISNLLLPLTIPLRLSNYFFNYFNKFKTKKILSICVGNIYLGGTGKTPTTIKLYEILKKMNIATVTAKKFYPSHIDEITLLKKKTKLIVGKNRLEIIKRAIDKRKKIIIFDDGLQDRSIDYSLKFVCFDTINWIGNGKLIPSGPLREKLSNLKRFDAVFLKNIDQPNLKIINSIKLINPKIKIFNSKYTIKNLKKLSLSKKYLAFSGIGNPESFKKLLKKYNFNIINYINYPDHHSYTNQEFLKIIEKAKNLKAKIITTEKDFVKIPKIYRSKIKFLDVDLKLEDKKKLINFVMLNLNE